VSEENGYLLRSAPLKWSSPPWEDIKGGMVRQAHHDYPEQVEGSPPPLNHVRFRAKSCTLRGAGPLLGYESYRLPPSKGEGIIREISNIFGQVFMKNFLIQPI